MTWEQEMKEQAHFLAEEWAPVMAQELAQELAQDMAKDMAKDLAKGMAKNMAKDMAKDMAKGAKAEGQIEKAIETAKNMFKLNLTVQQIADCTGLSCSQVEKLQKEVMSTIKK